MSIYDAGALISRVRRRAQLPTSAYTDQQILDVAYEAILESVLPALKRTRENYRLARTDIATVADQGSYRIPSRAQGGALRTVSLVRDGIEHHLTKLSLDDLQGDRTVSGIAGFVVEGDLVTILPTPSVSTDSIRLRYQLSFPKLVPTSEAALVSSVAGDVVTCSSIPAGWTTSDIFDVLQGRSGFDALDVDEEATVVSSPNITLPTATLTEVQSGDWITLAGESPVITLPDSLHPAVFGFTASRILFEVGEKAGGGVERGMAKAALDEALGALSPRVDGRPTRIVNRRSLLRMGRGR